MTEPAVAASKTADKAVEGSESDQTDVWNTYFHDLNKDNLCETIQVVSRIFPVMYTDTFYNELLYRGKRHFNKLIVLPGLGMNVSGVLFCRFQKLKTINFEYYWPEAPPICNGECESNPQDVPWIARMRLKTGIQNHKPSELGTEVRNRVKADAKGDFSVGKTADAALLEPFNKLYDDFKCPRRVVTGRERCSLELLPKPEHYDPEDESMIYVSSIGLIPLCRDNGIGKVMLYHILRLAYTTPGVRFVALHVQTSNTDALRFYQRYGFHILRTSENYYSRITPPSAHYLVWSVSDFCRCPRPAVFPFLRDIQMEYEVLRK